MKKLLILLLFPIYCTAQYPVYIEINGGVGITYEKDVDPMGSILVGKLFPMGDYSYVDIQVGVELQTIFTGKIGVGSYFDRDESISIQIGLRCYPASLYMQFMFGEPDKMQMHFCAELGGAGKASVDYRSLFNMGLRIPLIKKK